MKIIDGQIHVWWPNSPQRPWPEGAVALHGPSFTVEQAVALLDENKVQGAVLVPPSWTGFDNSYATDAAKKYPNRFGVMGQFDVDTPDAKERLTHWRDEKGMLGVRLVFLAEPSLKILRDSKYDWFWATCEKANVPLMCLAPGNLGLLGDKARKHPGMTIIIDHAGRHPRGAKDEASWADIQDMLVLAKLPNVSVKVSSLPCFTTQAYPFPNLHAPMRQMYDAFGPQRLSWGSDITRLTSTYQENLRLFTEAFSFLTPKDLEWIMGGTVAKLCRWKEAQ